VDSQKRIVPSGSPGRVAFWRVTLGKRITGTKKHRRFFKTYAEAKDFVDSCVVARAVQGKEAFSIPQNLRVEAMECAKKLEVVGVTLTAAVDYYLRNALPVGGIRLFSNVCNEFIVSRRAMNCKPKTLVQYQSYIRILCEEFGKMKMTEVKRQDIEDWLSESEWSSRTRKNYLVTLTTLFNFGCGREYCTTNPAALIERPILDQRPPGILSVKQALELLKKALETDSEMVSGIAVGLFAGLRRSEICALDWSEINLATQEIEVKGIKAKTRQRRIVSIADNLLEWLRPYQRQSGSVAPTVDAFGQRLKDLSMAIKIKDWPHNALRHSMGSYFYEKHKSENLTAAEMGNTPAVVHKHYRTMVNRNDANEYWNIRPDSALKNTPSATCSPQKTAERPVPTSMSENGSDSEPFNA
jgi:site-specific recombinase XerD